MSDMATARAAKRLLQRDLRQIDGVNGIGLTRRSGDYSITVGVTEDRWRSQVPAEVGGVPVHVRVVGRITPSAST